MKERSWTLPPLAVGQWFEYTLPWPPRSGNHRNGMRGKRFFPVKEMVEWTKRVAEAIEAAGGSVLSGRLTVEARVFAPDVRKRDIDNIVKVIGDALKREGAINDDGDIDDVHFRRFPKSKDRPRVEIFIGVIKND